MVSWHRQDPAHLNQPSQRARLAILLIYVGLLFVASKVALGTWLPPTSNKGLWFYSGLAALILGNLLVTPFFTKPADAISYAAACIVALLATSVWNARGYGPFDRTVWLITISYVLSVTIAGILSIALKDSPRLIPQQWSRSLYAFCGTVGGPRSIFSAIFLFAIITFHRESPREFITIGVTWAILIGLHPIESLYSLAQKISEVWRGNLPTIAIGQVVAQQSPGIALVRQFDEEGQGFGELLALSGSDGRLTIGLAADYIGWADGRWLRVLLLKIPEEASTALQDRLGLPGTQQPAFKLQRSRDLPETIRKCLSKVSMIEKNENLLGIVAPGTDISHLRFEILRTDLDIGEGALVEVRIGEQMVLYQIINGITQEEILHQKNMYGFVRGDAKKIGCWDQERRGFEIIKWVPGPNEPVFIVKAQEYQESREAIGHFPDTNFTVSTDQNLLVTHNTAILGILGSGKSFLALEIAERLITEKIKVLILDLTNQYAQELQPYYDSTTEQATLEVLFKIGAGGKTNFQKNVEEGGSVETFSLAIKKDLKEFLSDASRFVKIYNPAKFEVWRQDSKPFQDRASMASLTPTEITRIIAEALLDLLQDKMSDTARACIIFEEAHSLIPEWNAVASEGDKAATNGTAKAILQGRKYGLGCIVVTQRTANVTKSILNQCNTVFALRVFDATGMEFLKNYFGEDYAGVLSSLEDRHAVAFGRGSSCRNPVLIRLNDRESFLKSFRKKKQ